MKTIKSDDAYGLFSPFACFCMKYFDVVVYQTYSGICKQTMYFIPDDEDEKLFTRRQADDYLKSLWTDARAYYVDAWHPNLVRISSLKPGEHFKFRFDDHVFMYCGYNADWCLWSSMCVFNEEEMLWDDFEVIKLC